jgi:hypothetical protein
MDDQQMAVWYLHLPHDYIRDARTNCEKHEELMGKEGATKQGEGVKARAASVIWHKEGPRNRPVSRNCRVRPIFPARSKERAATT